RPGPWRSTEWTKEAPARSRRKARGKVPSSRAPPSASGPVGQERRGRGDHGGDQRGAHDGGRLRRTRRGPKGDYGRRQEGDPGGRDGEEGAHGVGGHVFTPVEPGKLLHRFEAQRGRSISQS